jgi:hypothetical protein
MHRVLIPLLGMALGELWALDELAERCAADGRWDCMIVAKPLNLTGVRGRHSMRWQSADSGLDQVGSAVPTRSRSCSTSTRTLSE